VDFSAFSPWPVRPCVYVAKSWQFNTSVFINLPYNNCSNAVDFPPNRLRRQRLSKSLDRRWISVISHSPSTTYLFAAHCPNSRSPGQRHYLCLSPTAEPDVCLRFFITFFVTSWSTDPFRGPSVLYRELFAICIKLYNVKGCRLTSQISFYRAAAQVCTTIVIIYLLIYYTQKRITCSDSFLYYYCYYAAVPA